MGRFCAFGGNGKRSARAVGLALMVLGAIILISSAPRWLWTSALGIALISAGYLIWRFA